MARHFRENLIHLLKTRQNRDPVWTANITYWISAQTPETRRELNIDNEDGYLDFHRERLCMPYYWYGNFWAGQRKYNDVDVTRENQGEEIVSTWTCPAGSIIQKNKRVESDGSSAITKHAVENESDLRVLIDILEKSELAPSAVNDYPDRAEKWASFDGIPALGLPRSPLPAFFVEWAGVQNGIYLLMDQPDLCARVLDLFREQEQRILDDICSLQPPLVHFPDNLTSEVYTPFFESHMREIYEHRLEQLHNAGIHAAVHLDGTVRGMLPKLADAGFDAVEALTPEPAGDVTVEEMRSLAASDNVILWGGVPGAMFAPPYSEKDMEAHVRKTLDCWKDMPFVLGVADQVPPAGNIDMVKMIGEICAESQ